MAEIQGNVEQFAPLKKMIASNGDFFSAEQASGDTNFGGLVEEFLKYIVKNDIPEGFTWEDVKAVIVAKLKEITKTYEAEKPIALLPVVPNVDNYTVEEYTERILGHLNSFESSPFTIQRICELLHNPRQHYDRGDKFLRAFEKCVTVTSSNGNADSSTNGNYTNGNGHHAAEVTSSNGTATEQMETDHGETNGHANGITNGTTETETPLVDATPGGEHVEAIAATETVDAEVTSGQDATIEEEKQSLKRPSEDIHELDTGAVKIPRLEHNGVNGNTHTVVGEPEIEPDVEPATKKMEVDQTPATTEAEVAVEQEAAV